MKKTPMRENCYANPSRKILQTMKLTVFLFFLGFMQALAGNSLAQTTKLSLDVQNSSIESILQDIEKQSDFRFIYNKEKVDLDSRVNIRLQDKSVKEVLDILFQGKNVNYTFFGNNIVLSNARTATVQQYTSISGRVTDSSHTPLPGVTIVIKGTTQGTITDVNGNYSFASVSPDATLVFSFIGMKAQEIPVSGRKTIDVVMTEETVGLDEVVAIGYGTISKKELTSAVSHVNSAELLQSGNINPLMSIQGLVSGLSITNTQDGNPNANPSIQLRGVSSRDAGSDPLIVIDGVPGGNLENINQNDIASIDVLKDGAASAIYGTRGSAGVILVTTKKGHSGAITTTYDGYSSIGLPNNQLKPLTTADYLKNNRGPDYGGSTDWLKEVSRDFSFTQSHTLSVSGGNNHTNYRGTVDYRKANGLDLRSDREEYGARLALNFMNPNNLYKISFNIAPRYVKFDNANNDVFTQGLTLNPTYPVKDPDDPTMYYSITGSDGQFNPVELQKLEQSGSEAKFLDWDGTFKLNITQTLNSQVTLAQSTKDYFDFWFKPSNMTTEIQNGYQGEASRNYNKYDQRSLEWLTNYSFTANQHSLKAMVGYSYQYFMKEGMSADNKNFTSNATTYNNLGDGLYQQVEGRNGMGSYKEDSKLIAFFGRISYSFADKYLLTASLRREGSSKFGINNKWGNFPAISLGWRISKEPFMDGIDWIDDLKLRGDYGVTGNQNFGNYLSLSTYGGYGYYLFNGSYYQVWGPANNTNNDLKWEKGKNMNIGLDFALVNNVVQGSINYYRRTQQDLLGWYNAPVPPNPQAQTYANVGSMRNTGLEIDLNVKAISKKNFSYRIGLVGATNDNKFLSFSNNIFQGQDYVDMAGLPAPGTPGAAQRLQEGKRIGNFYMWKFAGVDQNGNMLVYSEDGEIIQANKATNDDKQVVGNGLPHFTASMNHSFRYKNWDLNLYFRGAFGYDIFNIHEFYYGLQSSPNTNVLPSAYGKNDAIKGDKVLCDYFLEKGDYVKLDIVNIGYTIKSNSKYFNSIRLYASGKNLAKITGFSGIDPEIYPVNGLTPGVNTSKSYYPTTMQLLLGAQISF